MAAQASQSAQPQAAAPSQIAPGIWAGVKWSQGRQWFDTDRFRSFCEFTHQEDATTYQNCHTLAIRRLIEKHQRDTIGLVEEVISEVGKGAYYPHVFCTRIYDVMNQKRSLIDPSRVPSVDEYHNALRAYNNCLETGQAPQQCATERSDWERKLEEAWVDCVEYYWAKMKASTEVTGALEDFVTYAFYPSTKSGEAKRWAQDILGTGPNYTWP